MKDERKGVSKKAIVKAAKENEDLFQFVKSLSAAEIARIKEVREFQDIETGTYTYKIALMCDSLRQNVRSTQSVISRRMWMIDDLTNSIRRFEVQKSTGNITQVMKDGSTVMNVFELDSLIQNHVWLRDGEVNALIKLLADLRANVGHKDVVLNMIITKEQFNTYVQNIERDLTKYGYELFGAING